MTTHRSFPKPGKGIPAAPKPRAPKAKPTKKTQAVEKEVAARAGETKKAKPAKAPKAGPTGKPKFKPVDEGNGTVFVKLTPDEIRERGKELATQLQKREQEVDAQAETRSAMKARLDEFDNKIHQLGIAIREGREERPAPGLFDKLSRHKTEPIAKDTMKKPESTKATGKTDDKLVTNAPEQKGVPDFAGDKTPTTVTA